MFCCENNEQQQTLDQQIILHPEDIYNSIFMIINLNNDKTVKLKLAKFLTNI